MTDLIVTKMKGRWEIKVSPHKSNTVRFKVDKREQIVIVANSWVGATKKDIENIVGRSVGNPCYTLASVVYNHVGFLLPDSEQQYDRTIIDTSRVKGRLILYSIEYPSFNPGHVAIQIDTGHVVDINCNDPAIHPDPTDTVQKHSLLTTYAAHEHRSPKELIDLDGE